MSVQSYLEDLASELVLSTNEKSSINISVSTLSKRIISFFGSDLIAHGEFGSYTRGTILPRPVDSYSDVDYMIIFKNPYGYKPQTLLMYLKKFVEKYYSRSEIYRDSPTMVLELQHIKFELVPAINHSWRGICIPSPNKAYDDWMETDPNGFNTKLTRVNTDNGFKIKPLIRLMKYWNTLHNHYYSSFLMEDWLCAINNYYSNNLKNYFYNSIDRLSYNYYNEPRYIIDAIDRAKKSVSMARSYEYQGFHYQAEQEIKKILPQL